MGLNHAKANTFYRRLDWSSTNTIKHFITVEELHKEFLRAGSDVLQAFTFFASEDMMKKVIDSFELSDVFFTGLSFLNVESGVLSSEL